MAATSAKAPGAHPEGHLNLIEYRLMHRLQAVHHFT